MRKWLGIVLIAVLSLLWAGCGGGGGGGSRSSRGEVTRTLVGFVYVKKAGSTAPGPNVIITPAQTPPNADYDVPTQGVVSLIANEAKFRKVSSRSNDLQFFSRDLSEGNDILITASTTGDGAIRISGANISIGSTPRVMDYDFVVNLRDGGPNLTTLNLNSPGSPENRTPSGAVTEVKFSFDGKRPSELGNQLAAGQKAYLSVAFFDANGVSFPNTPAAGNAIQTTSSDPAKISIDPNTKLVTPALGGQLAGPVTITSTISNPPAVGSLTLEYSYGEPSNVDIFRKDARGNLVKLSDFSAQPYEIRWLVATNPRPTQIPTSVELIAIVTNRYGGAIPEQTIVWTNPAKAPNNEWRTSVGGPCFVDPDTEEAVTETTTDLNGRTVVKVVTPPPVDGDLGGAPASPSGAGGSGDSFPKFQNFLFATVKGTTVRNEAPAKIYLSRDLQFLRIREKTTTLKRYIDVGAREQYTAYGVDVDQDEAENPPSAVWTVTNKPGGHKTGNPGERELQANIAPTSQATMEQGGVLVAGNIAGEVTITVSSSDTLSGLVPDSYDVSIYGLPKQVLFVDGPQEFDPNAPWEVAVIPVGIAQNPFTQPASEVRYSQGQPNGDNPPEWVAYLYAGMCDSWGHYLNALASIDYELTVAKGEPYHPFAIEVVTDPVGQAGEPCAIITFAGFGAGFGEARFTIAGTYAGVRGGLSQQFSITRAVRVNTNQ
ncbi:MAG: hypothetical protein N2109_00210 [Fimbriimonadales bacterium]|nr:hypothetical protein [Fimbriimonadales bacterium]